MLSKKDLLGLKELSAGEIFDILDLAAQMKSVVLSNNRKLNHLSGKTVITLFYENSTRTRMSFELASKYLGANAANISSTGSSVAKGETLIDTGRNLDAMGCDVIVIRHSSSGAAHLLSRSINASVVNAGDGMNEHPTQALLDMMTIRQYKGSFEGLKVAIIGDIMHSRVARSNIIGLTKVGARVHVCGPDTLMPPGLDIGGAIVEKRIEDAVRDADVVMGLRLQLERQKKALFPSTGEYSSLFGIDRELLTLAKPELIVMHPGPVNRGVEMTSEVVDGKYSRIIEQVTNGVAVRMAVLDLLVRRRYSSIHSFTDAPADSLTERRPQDAE